MKVIYLKPYRPLHYAGLAAKQSYNEQDCTKYHIEYLPEMDKIKLIATYENTVKTVLISMSNVEYFEIAVEAAKKPVDKNEKR